MDNREKVIEALKVVKGQYFDQEEKLITEGWIDSFDLIKLIKELEQSCVIAFDYAKITANDFDSVDSICRIINANGNGEGIM